MVGFFFKAAKHKIQTITLIWRTEGKPRSWFGTSWGGCFFLKPGLRKQTIGLTHGCQQTQNWWRHGVRENVGVKNLAPPSASWLGSGPVKPHPCSALPWRQPCLVAGQLCSRMQPSQLMRHRFKAWILPPTHKRRRLTLAPRPTPRPKTVVKIPADPAVSQPLDDPQHTSWISHHWGQTSIETFNTAGDGPQYNSCQHIWGQASINTVTGPGSRRKSRAGKKKPRWYPQQRVSWNLLRNLLRNLVEPDPAPAPMHAGTILGWKHHTAALLGAKNGLTNAFEFSSGSRTRSAHRRICVWVWPEKMQIVRKSMKMSRKIGIAPPAHPTPPLQKKTETNLRRHGRR